ncbi:MAG: phage tail tape measure protein [Phycisphaerae bacterium]|jgi:TP901 family phage tail tape measure protein
MAGARGIRAGRAYVELGVNDKIAAGLKAAQRRLQAFGASVRSIGQRMVAVSAGAAIPLALSGKVFANFEQKMARVQALTGATGKDFERLATEAKRLGETTVFSASQAAEAMSFFALAGYDVEKILTAIGPTLNLAAAGQLEIAQAADIAAKIMAGMGLEADQLGYAVDVLTKAMTTANTDLNQLGDAMKFVGPIAKSAGIAFEEVVAAVQLLSNAGIQGEMAGTTLRGAILALTSPSSEAADVLKELGVSVTDASGNVRPLADIIGQLNRAMEGMGSGQKLDILGRIFPARTAAGVAELLSQGADKLREYTAALGESGGTAAKIAGTQLNTLQGNATILKSAIEGLAIAVGESLGGPLRVVIDAVTRVVGQFAQWIRANRELVVMVSAAVVGVGALGAGLVGLGVAAQAAGFVLGGLGTILVAVKAALIATTAVLAAMASPIGLVVTAAATLGTALVVYSGAGADALAWLGETWGWLRDTASKVLKGISDALAAGDMQLAAQVMWAGLRVVWKTGVGALNKAWLAAKQFFVRIAYDMWYGAQAAFEIGCHGIKIAWVETTAFMSRMWYGIVDGIKDAWNAVEHWLQVRWIKLKYAYFLLSDEQKQAAIALVDQQYAAKSEGAKSESAAALDQLEADRKAALQKESDFHQSELERIGQADREASESLGKETDAATKAAEDALAQAKADLDAALKAAAKAREEAGLPAAPGRPAAVALPNMDDVAARVANAIAPQTSAAGTFNPFAVQGLGPSSVAERTLKATEDVVKGVKRVEEKLDVIKFSHG